MRPVAPAAAAAGRLAHYAVSGVVGGLIVRGASKRLPDAKPVARKALIGGIANGIAAGRWSAPAAEEARPKAGGMLAEGRAGPGEEVPPPSAVRVEDHDHGHEH
ncbi:DUF1490 family protein [Streptomyces sp. NPDC003016]